LGTDIPDDDRLRLAEAFKSMMKALYNEEGSQLRIDILAEPPAQDFITTHASILDSAMQRAPLSDIMRQRLQQSNYIFSGIKTFHECNEAFSLLDSNGERKPFERFLNDVRKIDETYNRHYLRAEYNFVNASADMAAKWEEFAQDGDRYNLQYRTAGDEKVRPEHAALHGVTLPIDDPFWRDYFPPNGWNCRCTVVQVRKSKYPVTPHDEAMQRGADATAKDSKGIFRFNSGLEQKSVPDYNPYTIKRCRDCDIAKGKINLAHPSDNELCDECKLLRQYNKGVSKRFNRDVPPPAVEQYESVHGGNVLVSPMHGENERMANQELAEFISDKTGAKVYLLPRLDPKNPTQLALRSTLLPTGVIEGKNPDYYIGGMFFDAKSMMNIQNTGDPQKWKSAIENRIKDAKKQADNIVLEIPEFVTRKVVHSTIINYLNRSKKNRIIFVKWNDRLLMYDRKKKTTTY